MNYILWINLFIVMIIIDAIYLRIIQYDYLQGMLKKLNPIEVLRSMKFPLWTFIIVYLLMSFALYYFVLRDYKSKSNKQLFLEILLLALVIYVTFDFSMLNLVGNWTMRDAIQDIGWGVTLFFLTSIITLLCYNYLKGKKYI
jgi:uncharacterized membrane protein